MSTAQQKPRIKGRWEYDSGEKIMQWKATNSGYASWYWACPSAKKAIEFAIGSWEIWAN
jgi:hypothetical protein